MYTYLIITGILAGVARGLLGYKQLNGYNLDNIIRFNDYCCWINAAYELFLTTLILCGIRKVYKLAGVLKMSLSKKQLSVHAFFLFNESLTFIVCKMIIFQGVARGGSSEEWYYLLLAARVTLIA